MEQQKKVEARLWPLWVPILLGMIAVTSLFIQLSNPIISADLWWHMLHGRQILESGSLVADHSIFTWTPAISYFPYTSWLGQIILYLIYEFTGSTGLMALRYGVFFLIFMLGWRYALTRGITNNPITWTVIFIGIALTWQAPLIKTELFTTCLFTTVIWLYFHMRYRGDQAWWMTYLLPFILLIWVNTHGAFIMAALFFTAAIVGEILNSKFSPNQAMSPRQKRHFFIALALCLPVLFISPYGYDLPYSIIKEVVLTDTGFHSRVSSYIPTYLFNVAPYYLLDYFVVAIFTFIFLLWQKLKNKQTDWVVILAFLGYSAIFPKLARVTFFLGPVFIFICLDMLAEKKESWAWSSSKATKTVLAILCLSLSTLMGWRTFDNNICRLSSYQDGIKQSFGVSASFPITETEYIKKNLHGKKIGNMYRDGGYLEYHLWPEKQAMIDTRYFPFRSWINDYFDFVDGKDIDEFVKDHPADFWLVNYKFANPVSWFIRSSDWKPAFLGPTGAVFVPSAAASEKPQIASNLRSRLEINDYVHSFRASIALKDLTFAKRIYEAATSTHGTACSGHVFLTHEMRDSIAGIEAYNAGKYQEAYRILKKNTVFIQTQGKAADALMNLAQRSLDQGDIRAARDWYLKIFKMLPKVGYQDIFNLALLDRKYRFSNIKGLQMPTDDLHWQRLVTLILMERDKIPQALSIIVKTAEAMKDGSYDGTVKLLPRYRDPINN